MEKKIRVLQVTGSLRVGGLENVAMNIFRSCDRTKFSFDFLVYGDSVEPLEKEVAELGGRVFHIPYPHKGVKKYMSEMEFIMKTYGPYDVVHSHSLFNSGFVMKTAHKVGVPIRISHAHSDRRNTKTKFPRSVYNSYMRYLINKFSTEKFACSVGAGTYLYGKGFSEKVHIAKNGILVSKFLYDSEKRENIKKEFGWEGCKIVGHIGRLAPVKNQKKIINAFNYAYKKETDLRLLIAGDGELREELQKQIDSLGLSDVAKLAGTRNDVPALLSSFDVYMMPSFYEGVSISLIEAQSSGVHCLVSAGASAPETRLTKCIHIMDLEQSDEDWGEQLLSLIKKERMSDSAEVVINAGYDVPGIVKKELEFYC